MMRRYKQKWKLSIALLLLAVLLLPQTRVALAGQMSTYTTYTYDKDGYAVNSPAAYEFKREYAGTDLRAGAFNHPSDIFVDEEQNIYVVDTGNNRIVVLNKEFKLINSLEKFINPDPKYAETDGMDSFSSLI